MSGGYFDQKRPGIGYGSGGYFPADPELDTQQLTPEQRETLLSMVANRTMQGKVGFWVLTPLRLRGDEAVLVPWARRRAGGGGVWPQAPAPWPAPTEAPGAATAAAALCS